MEKLARFLGWSIVLVAIVVLVARLLFVTTWTVPAAEKQGDDWLLAASIAPTLADGDLLVVRSHGDPGFADLVRCPDPDDRSKFVVGRVVGLGGDSIEVKNHDVVVGRTAYHGESSCPEPKVIVKHPATQSDTELRCDIVNMGGGWHYRGVIAGKQAQQTQTQTHADVGAGMVYLLSDDRDFHDDSRDFGAVPAAGCQKILFRIASKAGWSDDKHRLSYIR